MEKVRDSAWVQADFVLDLKPTALNHLVRGKPVVAVFLLHVVQPAHGLIQSQTGI